MSTIPAAVLAEAHKVYCGGRFAGFEEALAVIARHWPAATPDRYAAGFRDGVEKAAANVDEIAASHEHDAAQAAKTEYPEDGHAARDMAHAHRKAATTIRALAPPDDGLVVGRLRWVQREIAPWENLQIGNVHLGSIGPDGRQKGAWAAYLSPVFWGLAVDSRTSHDTPEAARAALVEAVRREVEGGGDE